VPPLDSVMLIAWPSLAPVQAKLEARTDNFS